MPRYSDESRERVRDAIDFVNLVSARTDLRKSGGKSYTGLCPFHEERTPSFSINPVDKVYHCFGCQAGGDVFKFVMETEGLDFGTALESLADRYGIELEPEDEDPREAERRRRRERLYALLERTAGYYGRYLWEAGEAADARQYLEGRGLGEEVLREFRVGFAPAPWDRVLVASRTSGYSDEELLAAGLAQRGKGGQLYDRFRRRIMFPLCDMRGRVLGFGARATGEDQQPKYLNTAEGDLYHKRRQLFGADKARAEAARAERVIVVEGYTDVLALHQAGMRNVVGMMGTALTEQQVGQLAQLVGGGGRVDFALDADSAGQRAVLAAARVAERRDLTLMVVELPAGRDPADIVQEDGAEAMGALTGKAVALEDFEIDRILEGADTAGSVEGREHALHECSAVIGSAPLVLRDELARRVALRLDVPRALVEELVRTGAGRAPAVERAGAGGASPARPAQPRTLSRAEQTERSFLALCLALPEQGRDALRRVDVERHFTSGATQRAAAHLRDHVAAPMEGVEGDGRLAALIAELTLRAQHADASPATLRVEELQLEKARLEREIAAAQTGATGAIADLAMQRTKVKDELDLALDQAMERTAGGA